MISKTRTYTAGTLLSMVALVMLCLLFLGVPPILIYSFGKDTYQNTTLLGYSMVPNLCRYLPLRSPFTFAEGLCFVFFLSLWIISLACMLFRHRLFPRLSMLSLHLSWITIVALWPFWSALHANKPYEWSPWRYIPILEDALGILCISIPFSLYFIFSKTARRVFSRGILNSASSLPRDILWFRFLMTIGGGVTTALLIRMAWVWWLGLLLCLQPEMWRAAGTPEHYVFLPVTGDQMVHSLWPTLLIFEAAGILVFMFCLIAGCVSFLQCRARVCGLPILYMTALLFFALFDFVLSRIIYPRPPLEFLATLALCTMGVPLCSWMWKRSSRTSCEVAGKTV